MLKYAMENDVNLSIGIGICEIEFGSKKDTLGRLNKKAKKAKLLANKKLRFDKSMVCKTKCVRYWLYSVGN